MPGNGRRSSNSGQQGQTKVVDKKQEGMPTPPTVATQYAQVAPGQTWSTNVTNELQTSQIVQQANGVLYQYAQNSHQPSMVIDAISQNGRQNQYTTVPVFRPTEQQYHQQQSNNTITDDQFTMNTTMNTMNVGNSERNAVPVLTSVPSPVLCSNPLPEPPWVAQMLKGLDTRLQHIETQLVSQNNKWQSIDSTLQSQNTRITKIEQQLTEFNTMKQDLSRMQNSLYDMGQEVSGVNSRMKDYDESIHNFNDKYDQILLENSNNDKLLKDLCAQVDRMQVEQEALYEQQSKSESRIIDLQCRSMRDNLLFTGIEEPELQENEFEDTENTLNQFLSREMNISRAIPFHRVHRLGPADRNQTYPRHIVAKFEHFKDRESVRRAAPKTLKNKPFGVREQFPKEIEDKRKRLYPQMKIAKRDERNKVKLIKDKLYINNVEYVPSDSEDTDSYVAEQRESQRDYQNKGARPKTYNIRTERREGYSQSEQRLYTRANSRENSKDQRKTEPYYKERYFYQKPVYRHKNRVSTDRNADISRNLDFSVETRNSFEQLHSIDEEAGAKACLGTERSKNVRKATSPLDSNLTFKKHREDSDSDIEVDNSPQSDPPTNKGHTISDSPICSIAIQEVLNSATLNDGPVVTKSSATNTVVENEK